jgi:cephalosporin-C deacetylase-like acetyl esterase
MFRTLAAITLLFLALAAHAEKPPMAKPGDAMIEDYLAHKTAALSERILAGAKTLQAWQSQRAELHRQYLDMLGLWPMPERTPLHATVTGTLEHEGVAIEKVHFQSRPGLYVTGNLYRPKKIEGKLPAILYLCGHSDGFRNGNKVRFQDHGLWFASNGYVCLIIDTLQLGEIPGIHHGTYNRNRWWWHAAGYTPAGVECWNGVRAIDYLASRPDVDITHLGMTGISGGGAATVWISAADDRVTCAVPVSGMSDLESYVTHKVINGHCDCMFLYNNYAWEWTTIAALIAPRPMLFANSDQDPIFPMDGNRRIIARLRQLYELHEKPSLVNDYVSAGGHDYRPDLRLAIFKWINRHVKGDNGAVQDTQFKPIPHEALRVFPTDADLPRDSINGKIDETFVARAQVALPSADNFSAWQAGLLKQVRQRVFHNLSQSVLPLRAANDQDKETYISEPGIQVHLQQRFAGDAKERACLLVADAADKPEEIATLAKTYATGGLGLTLQPRGIGTTAWTSKSPPNYVARAHLLLGQTVDEGRVYDTLATLKKDGSQRWRVVGRGQAGIVAAYAALLDPSVDEVVIVDPPASHRDGPYFLGVLRVLDIPEALGLLAPRPLTLVNANDKAFERTTAIYQRAGAADKIKRLQK